MSAKLFNIRIHSCKNRRRGANLVDGGFSMLDRRRMSVKATVITVALSSHPRPLVVICLQFSNGFESSMDYANYITAGATLAIAALTLFLLLENRTLRKAGSTPELVAYLSPHPDGHGGIEFVLANVGSGPAFDVTFSLEYDDADFEAHDVMVLNDRDRMPISVIPQDAQQRALFGISFVLYGNTNGKSIGPLKPFKVLINYSDIFGRKQVRERTIDIRQFAGLHGLLAKSNAYKAAQSLESIDKHLASLSKQAARFSAFVDVTQIKDEYVQIRKGDPSSKED